MKAKKILAVILTVAMLLSMTTFSVAAESTEVATYADFKTAVEAGNSVILTADITTDSAFNISGETLEIDLNGKTLKIGAGDNYISDASSVTIKNGTINLNGTVASGNAIFCIGVYDAGVVSTLTLNGVTVTGKDYSSAFGVFYLGQTNDAGAMSVINSTITLDNDLAAYADGSSSGGVFKADGAGATLSITGSTLNLTDVDRAVTHCATTVENSTVTIKGTSTDKLEHGFNRSALTITNSQVSISGGSGRGITAENGAVVIDGKSTVDIYDMGEATIELRGAQPLTVADTATVTVDTAVSAGTSTVTGTVAVNENLGAAVAKIGDTNYATLAEAIIAANKISGEVTVEIYGKAEYTAETANLNGSYSKINFVGKTADAEIYMSRKGTNGYISGQGSNAAPAVTFTDLILSKNAGDGTAYDAAHMDAYFTVYRVASVDYKNCTFPNGACAQGCPVTYDNCDFANQATGTNVGKYSLWVYANTTVKVTNSKFTGVRGAKMYGEGASKTGNLILENTVFTESVTQKPAIVLTYGQSITLKGNTYPDTGVFELDKDGAPNGTTVTADITDIACMNDNYADCGVLVDGKIYTTVTEAAAVATSGSTVTLMYNTTETVEFAEGVTLNKNGYTAANVTVAESAAVAKIGDIYYETINEAVSKAKSGDTVELLADVADTGTLLITNGVTFEGNGKTISGKSAIHMSGESTVQNTYFKDTSSNAIWSEATGIDITITGCTFENVGWDAILISGTHIDGDKVTITNNVFKGTSTAGRYVHIQPSGKPAMVMTVTNNKMYNTEEITAIGAWFAHEDSTINLSKNYIAEPDAISVTVYNDDSKQVNISEVVFPCYTDDTMTTLGAEPCAKVMSDIYNSTYYATLAEAVEAAEDGQEVVLLSDATGAGIKIKKNLTIDFGGYTYTVNSNAVGSTGTETLAFQILAGSSAVPYDVTFKNGTIEVVEVPVEGNEIKVVIMNYSNLTLTDMVVDGTGNTEMQCVIATNNGTMTLNGATTVDGTNASWAALDCDGTVDYYNTAKLVVNTTGTIKGKTEIYGEEAITEIKAGTFTGSISVDETATITITGGTFATDVSEYCADGFEAVKNADGTYGVQEASIWATDTDAGYYLDGETKYGMMRFLFAAEIDESKITKSGIKYIKAADITDDEKKAAAGVSGNKAAFYGDVAGFTEEEATASAYIAVAYIETTDGQTIWSEAVECAPDFTTYFEGYTPDYEEVTE